MKKWLSFGEHQLLGRPINPATKPLKARLPAALLLLTPALDASYAAKTTATPAATP